jgi:leucyl-tRNA synthetase
MVPTREPYKKRTSHGMILGPDGEKMSKSRGNVINPDEMVEKFGADAFRTYIAFMGPFDQAVMWDTNGLVGVKRFLDKVWALQEKVSESFPGPSVATEGNRVPSPPQGRGQGKDSHSRFTSILHQTIKKSGG